MTKKDIAEQIADAEDVFLSKKDIYRIISHVFDIIENSLRSYEKVQISGFGTFMVKKRKAKIGRNPKTGEEVPVPDRYVLVFKPSYKMLNMIEMMRKRK